MCPSNKQDRSDEVSANVMRVWLHVVTSVWGCIEVDWWCRESKGKAKIEGYMSISDEEAHQRLLWKKLWENTPSNQQHLVFASKQLEDVLPTPGKYTSWPTMPHNYYSVILSIIRYVKSRLVTSQLYSTFKLLNYCRNYKHWCSML